MTRIFICLAGAMGLLTLSGCGEVQGGAPVAPNTAALKPLPPAPEDKDMKITPSPLTPSVLPPAGALPAGAQQQDGQPANAATQAAPPLAGEPAAVVSTGTPSAAPPTAPPVAPPANGGGGLLPDFSIFGKAAAPKAAAPGSSGNSSNPAPLGQPVHVSLSGAAVTRIGKDQLHYEFAYMFDLGKPNPTNWYTVVVDPVSGSDGATPPGEIKIEGKDLQPQGKREGDVNMGGRSSAFAIHVTEGASREDKGHVISLIVVCAVHRNLQHLEPAAVGVGAQGKGYGAGMITTPVSVYFAAKEMIVFNIKIPYEMKSFKASNNRNPNSQEEFMEKIIKDGGITLPELPAGQSFVYDPQTGELGVLHPEK